MKIIKLLLIWHLFFIIVFVLGGASLGLPIFLIAGAESDMEKYIGIVWLLSIIPILSFYQRIMKLFCMTIFKV